MRWLLLLLLTGFAATCGQKGPLEPPPKFAQLTTVMTIGHGE